MLEMEQALEMILSRTSVLSPTTVPLMQSLGAFLAEDVLADIDLPPFDNSAVDGYAVRSGDTRGASSASPVALREIGRIAAGQSTTVVVEPGTACRIMTGAPMPPGADSVVMIEDTRMEGANVFVLEEARTEQHVRRTGEDLRAGTRVLQAGARIRPAEIAMLATVGRGQVLVVRQPRVAVFSTGDELVDLTTPGVPPDGKIRDSNRYTLGALVRDAGAVVHSTSHIPDDPDATEAALRQFADPQSGVDVVMTAGGVSVGDHDYVKPAVEKLGRLELWKVAIKPGKPLAFGSIGPALFFGLPGNPISAMVTFELFARPALRAMAGATGDDLFRRRVKSRVMEAVPHMPGRREYVRIVTEWRGDGFESEVSGKQGSGMLHSAAAANSLLIVPTNSHGLAAGSYAEVLLID